MSLSRLIENAKNSDACLAKKSKTVVGADFDDSDDQRWQVAFKYTGSHPKQVSLHNDETGDFLGWDSNKNVKMEASMFWWIVTRSDGLYTFQVNHNGAADSSQTLELQDDGKVALTLQSGNPTKAQQWKLLDRD